MKRIVLMLVSVLGLVAMAQVGDLERSTAAGQGVDPVAVTQFIDSLLAVPRTHIHHVMVVRHGKVIAEAHPVPYRAQDAHTLYSASKTFTSLAVGIAIDENRLRLDDRVVTFFLDKQPATISPWLAQMTVRDLLTMASGIKPDWVKRNNVTDWVQVFLAKEVGHEPGTYFQYDSMCTFMLAAIVQRVTGMTLLDYLNKHLFGPMHITQVDWQQSPDGINTGGWGLRLQTESLAKAGILMLNHGQWQGKQLVSQSWIDEAVKPHINYATVKPTDAPTEGNQGYGYQVWRCKNPEAFRADGAFGQYIVCIPSADMVVVITGMSDKGHDELGCIWKYLMPGVDNVPQNPLKGQQLLEAACARAALPIIKGKKNPRVKPMTMTLDNNNHGIATIAIAPTTGDRVDMTLNYHNGTSETIAMDNGKWVYNRLNGTPPYSIVAQSRFKGLVHDFEVAAHYGCQDKQSMDVRLEYVNFISATSIHIDYKAGTVTMKDNWTNAKSETVAFH